MISYITRRIFVVVVFSHWVCCVLARKSIWGLELYLVYLPIWYLVCPLPLCLIIWMRWVVLAVERRGVHCILCSAHIYRLVLLLLCLSQDCLQLVADDLEKDLNACFYIYRGTRLTSHELCLPICIVNTVWSSQNTHTRTPATSSSPYSYIIMLFSAYEHYLQIVYYNVSGGKSLRFSGLVLTGDKKLRIMNQVGTYILHIQDLKHKVQTENRWS